MAPHRRHFPASPLLPLEPSSTDVLRSRHSALTPCSAASGVNAIDVPSSPGNGPWKALLLALLCVTAASAAAYAAFPSFSTALDGIAGSVRSWPGFIESLSLIFMCELGDKTFFIAALLAMRLGQLVTFLGATTALAAMTVISVGIGVVFANVPPVLHTTAPVGQYVGAALLFYFGVRSIQAGLEASPEGGEELDEAQKSFEAAETGGKITGKSWFKAFCEAATLIFIAEWGDRSMLATIALAVHSNPYGVAVGASLGHALATAIAVVAGALASKYISERMVSIIGGVLFLLFAVETGLGLGIL